MLSNPKVEKVVKPPKRPVSKKRVNSGVIKLCFSARLAIIPIKKQPSILATNVPEGNCPVALGSQREILYLAMVPKNPPHPTKINSFIS